MVARPKANQHSGRLHHSQVHAHLVEHAGRDERRIGGGKHVKVLVGKGRGNLDLVLLGNATLDYRTTQL